MIARNCRKVRCMSVNAVGSSLTASAGELLHELRDGPLYVVALLGWTTTRRPVGSPILHVDVRAWVLVEDSGKPRIFCWGWGRHAD